MSRRLPDPELEPTIKVGEAALILGVSLRAMYAAVERSECPSIRVGRCVRIPTMRFLYVYGLSAVNVHDAQ